MFLCSQRFIGNLGALGLLLGFPGGTSGKEPTCQCRRHETQILSLYQKDPLEKEMATHTSILACKNPMTEEPGELQSIGLQELDTMT